MKIAELCQLFYFPVFGMSFPDLRIPLLFYKLNIDAIGVLYEKKTALWVRADDIADCIPLCL